VLVSGHYSLRMDMTSSVVSQGDSVSVTCDVHNKLDTSPTFVFVKKIGQGDDEVRIASNHVLEELYQQTGRYRIEHNSTGSHRTRHVCYTLRITSTSFMIVTHLILTSMSGCPSVCLSVRNVRRHLLVSRPYQSMRAGSGRTQWRKNWG